MSRILLINPNSSVQTTAMMTRIAERHLPPNLRVEGLTPLGGPAMLVTEDALRASEAGVLQLAHEHMAPDVTGIMVAAYGSPGLDALRRLFAVPMAGLGEAAMRAAHGRPFGVATTTPHLVNSILADAAARGFGALCTGVRVTPGDPLAYMTDPEALTTALEEAVRACVSKDGAKTVIIGGGPLGEAAEELAQRCRVPVIAPIPAAVRHLLEQMA